MELAQSQAVGGDWLSLGMGVREDVGGVE